MNMLESPLEALAFNYVSFGIFTVVNNLWPWIAVITAAVSFWRIRNASGATSYPVKQDKYQPRNERNRSEFESQDSQPGPEPSTGDKCIEPPASASSPASLSACDVDGVTKGKFTLYYYEHEKEGDGELTAVKECEDEFRYRCGEWWESWERVMGLRKGDREWYRHQDLTVVNGNVVRLWDECRRERYSSCCAVW